MTTGRKAQVRLTAIDPDGGYHTLRTGAGYRWAGLAKDVAGNWGRLTKGHSHASVQSRTRTAARARAHSYTENIAVVPLRRINRAAVPKAIAAYFARHPAAPANARPTLAAVYYQGQGWVRTAPGQPVNLGLVIRYRSGPVVPPVIAVTAGGVTADFQLADLAA